MTPEAVALHRLTELDANPEERRLALKSFAEHTGWLPSDQLDEYPGTREFANGHLIVEHGMSNSAVITFLKAGSSFVQLDRRQQSRVLALSYSNLVDWHLFPDPFGTTFVYNRTQPAHYVRHSTPRSWHADAFDELTNEKISGRQLALDEALVQSLTRWKRILAADLDGPLPPASISSLFNALIFVRALEDSSRWQQSPTSHLLKEIYEREEANISVADLIKNCLSALNLDEVPEVLGDIDNSLSAFRNLDSGTLRALLNDFYYSRTLPYRYDFCIVSKHALSKIYESYVSILRDNSSTSNQLAFMPDVPDVVANKECGSYYTPQYIARFFIRYLQENVAPRRFRAMRAIDPASGSGIFLRTLLEIQCESSRATHTIEDIRNSFRLVTGIDIDTNACNATKLSLSLLHLVNTGGLPEGLDIRNGNALDMIVDRGLPLESFDLIIANPPYVKWDSLNVDFRNKITEYLDSEGRGKNDLYVAYIKLCIELGKPGAYICLVLPHTFLIANSARGMRSRIYESCEICLIADLSDVEVFDGINSYTVLVILQKKGIETTRNAVTIVRCRDFVGKALTAALQGRTVKTAVYQVFTAPPQVLKESTWRLLPSSAYSLLEKLRQYSKLSDFATIRTGIVTGMDRVFIRLRKDTPKSEKDVWVPIILDRDMQAYISPSKTDHVVFYPYKGDVRMSMEELQNKYPVTWEYLTENETELRARKSFLSGRVQWWSPAWPRPPKNILRPKIYGPHLMLFPKFSIDQDGKYLTTRGPVIYPSDESNDINMLNYFLGALNSALGYWQLSTTSHKYSRGYLQIEPTTLGDFRLPNPAEIDAELMTEFQQLMSVIIAGKGTEEVERRLNSIVADFYGLDEVQRSILGI